VIENQTEADPSEEDTLEEEGNEKGEDPGNDEEGLINASSLLAALPLLLSHIGEHQLPVVLMVTIQPWTYSNETAAARAQLTGLRRMSDVVFEAEGFASRREYPQPSEFRMYHGLLKVRKLSTITASTAKYGGGHFSGRTNNRQPTADLYGLKRDRRKLHIQMLHIPPEEFAEGGGSVGSGGVRSGAGQPGGGKKKSSGLGCASGGGAFVF
jgi:hypothetical protein